MKKHSLFTATALSACLLLSGCAGISERLAEIGKPPVLSSIVNPEEDENYKPISLPMPPQEQINSAANSLWQPSRQTFFKDQRAHKVGDILTVLIDVSDKANMNNKTERTRDADENQTLPHLLGLETQLTKKLLPEAFDPTAATDMTSSSTSTGDGKITRDETIKLKLAAMVIQVLPNGNFVIQGRQQMRVNYELRDLQLQGVVRPEDILNNNSISYEKIAEARISYGGKGNLSDIQTTRYGQQVYDAVFPF